jgi:hypothetical protein
MHSSLNQITFSGFPVSPINVPRLVYNVCDGASLTESSEKGEPRTSKEASAYCQPSSQLQGKLHSSPAFIAATEDGSLPSLTCFGSWIAVAVPV